MAKIEIKVTLADETEIVISQPVTAERRGEDASIPSIGAALLGSAVPSMVRALGLRTQQDEAEIMEQVAARASEMVQQVREAEAAEAAAAEQDAQVEADLDKHLAEETGSCCEFDPTKHALSPEEAEVERGRWTEEHAKTHAMIEKIEPFLEPLESDKHKPKIEITSEITPETIKETADKAIDRAGKQRRR